MNFSAAREDIPWYPRVHAHKCTGCKACFEFCSHGTYEWDDAHEKPVVANPYNCVVGCSNCAAQCPAEAIEFPPLSILKQYR